MAGRCFQVNLQTTFGGGEVFTRFLCDALTSLGWEVVLFVNAAAGFWEGMRISGVEIVRVESESAILESLPRANAFVLTHTVFSEQFARRVGENHVLSGLLHMPLYERNPAGLKYYKHLFGVSRYVIQSARERGYESTVYPDPLYGVADLKPRSHVSPTLRATSSYDWDRRKFRDRLLQLLEPGVEPFIARDRFVRRPGLTLGIVSRLTPIKQFPLMFTMLADSLRKFPDVNLEIFGSGGFRTVSDLRQALAPVRRQVRYWGFQSDVGGIYPLLDYVLSGMPEKEAMGLNLIEAQMSGTPVLVVRAPPFTETVVADKTGYMFEDPRIDHGASFENLLGNLVSGHLRRPDPREQSEHLDRFTPASFRDRIQAAFAQLDF